MTNKMFQSSFELTGYITISPHPTYLAILKVSKLFRAYGLYNLLGYIMSKILITRFQSSFELTGYITGIYLGR